MRDIFSIINIKDACRRRGLPYDVILPLLFGKKRLENLDLPMDEVTSRIAVLVTYNKTDRKVRKIESTIVITLNKESGKVLVYKDKLFQAKERYRVPIADLPYFKNLEYHISNVIQKKKTGKKACMDYLKNGAEIVWDDFVERIKVDLLKNQRKDVKYTMVLHYFNRDDIAELTGLKLADYYDGKTDEDDAWILIYYTVQEKVSYISYQVNCSDHIPRKFIEDVADAIDGLAEFVESLDITTNIVDFIKEVMFANHTDRKFICPSYDKDTNQYLGDLLDVRSYNHAWYNKLDKLLGIQYEDILEAFKIVGD